MKRFDLGKVLCICIQLVSDIFGSMREHGAVQEHQAEKEFRPGQLCKQNLSDAQMRQRFFENTCTQDFEAITLVYQSVKKEDFNAMTLCEKVQYLRWYRKFYVDDYAAKK